MRQDGYSFRLTAEADTYGAMGVAERTNASQGRQLFSHKGVAYQADSPRLTAFGSPVLMYSPTGQQKMYSPLYVNGACTGGSFKYEGFDGGCKNNRLLSYDIYPETQSQKLHVLGEVLLPNAATLYTELLASQQSLQIAANDWSGVSGKIADTIGAPGYLEAVLNGLNAEETYTFWQPDLPALRQKYKKTLLRASLGLKGEFKGWHYQASLLQSQFKATQSVEKDNLVSLGLLNGLSSLPNALMLKPLDAQNPLTAQLLNSREWGQASLASTALTSAQLRASRALSERQGQQTLWAWGLEGQQEKADTQFSQAMAQPNFKGQRHIMAAFSELQVPVRKDLDLLASLRADQYSDVGAAISSKLAARWVINRRWAMRGSAGTGFQAPSLAQVHQLSSPFLQATVQLGDCTEALKAAASTLKAADGQAVACTSNSALNVFTNGNPDLRLQKTKQATWGMAFSPSRNVQLSGDYWRVQTQDTLQLDSVQAVLADPLRNVSALMANPDLVSLDGGAGKVHNLALLLKMKNKGQAVKEGIDIQARYREPMRDGRWVMGMQATFMLKSKDRTSTETAWVSDLGAYSALSEVVTPRWRSQWMVGYEQAQTQWQFNINHTSAYVDKEVVAFNTVTGLSETVSGHKVRGFLTADMLAVYQASRRTQIRFGVTNLANSQPPLSFYSLSQAVWGVNSQNGNLQGRTLRAGATVRY
jgi:iron complex outermembrane receptor protein